MRSSQSVFCRQVKRWLAFSLVAVCAGSSISAQDGASFPPLPRGDFVQAMLAEHNGERKKLKLAPLVWDGALAKDAQRWADKLAKENRFDHAHDELSRNKQGENLWMGTANAYSYQEMVFFWLDERKMAKSGVFPDVSRTGNWIDIGHYTQMIWPSTQKMGCAIAHAPKGEDEFLVCRYFLAGNRIGDRLEVSPRK
jgi:hypothetical protein